MVDYAESTGRQYHIQTRPDEIGKYVILPGDPKRCEKIASFLEELYRCGADTFIRIGICGA